jgi:hypothetical protein
MMLEGNDILIWLSCAAAATVVWWAFLGKVQKPRATGGASWVSCLQRALPISPEDSKPTTTPSC